LVPGKKLEMVASRGMWRKRKGRGQGARGKMRMEKIVALGVGALAFKGPETSE